MILIFSILFITLIVYYNIFLRQLYSSSAIIEGNTHIKPNKLMIIAKPSDELMYGGVDLLNNDKWFVVCVTNGSALSKNIFTRDNKRITDAFVKIMNQLQCKYEIWDYEESFFNGNWNESLEKRLSKLLQVKFSKIVTYDSVIINRSKCNKQQKKLQLLVKNIISHNKVNQLSTFDDNLTTNDSNKITKFLLEYPNGISLGNKLRKSLVVHPECNNG